MIKIGNKTISDNDEMYIIAEIGVNHNGSLPLAKELIDLASNAGADAVKFQMFQTEEMVSSYADLAEYQKNNKYSTQKEMLKQLEFNKEQFKELKDYCDQGKITFLSTPFDLKSAAILNELGVDIFKVGSGDLTNYPLLAKLASYKKPIILSTGMSTLKEIEAALSFLENSTEIVLLHCTSAYPAPFTELNLNAIATLKSGFQKIIGYSDHSLGVAVPFAATAMGYKIIEKHFTYNKWAPGPDHPTSLEPEEFKQMVVGIRQIEQSLGSSIKKMTDAEKANKSLVRKGIYLAQDLEQGQKISHNHLLYLRPLSGIGAEHYQRVLGKELKMTLKRGEPLKWENLC